MPHIALVDDETNILTSVSLALESEGFTVDTYLNGEDALIGLEDKIYDLGLFDIKMPLFFFHFIIGSFFTSTEHSKKIH